MNYYFPSMRQVSATLFFTFLGASWALGQQSITVTTGGGTGPGSLPWAINKANANGSTPTIIQVDNTSVGQIVLPNQQFVNANVTLNGNGVTIDMQDKDRAFFIYGGNVAISNFTIKNGKARGGDAGDGGGGGAGLGAAIFAVNGSIDPNLSQLGTVGATNVTLQNVTFNSNKATGGDGGSYASAIIIDRANNGGGGGGGMGGNGGNSTTTNGGGGGGFGFYTPNESQPSGQPPIPGSAKGGQRDGTDAPASGLFPAGPGGGVGGGGGVPGGSNGGGGSGGGPGGAPLGSKSGGGGGGVGGQNGLDNKGSSYATGGTGGFGGGGGGSIENNSKTGEVGGHGGFGGGGGGRDRTDSDGTSSSTTRTGGSGGFGGGAGVGPDVLGIPGYGGGTANVSTDTNTGSGGGGAGMGGAVFSYGATVTFINPSFGGTPEVDANSATGGRRRTGVGNVPDTTPTGQGIGSDLFFYSGTNTIQVDSGSTTKITGTIGDFGLSGSQNVGATINKTGAGTLDLRGANNLSGTISLQQGRIDVANDKALGTALLNVNTSSSVTFGMPSGPVDDATVPTEVEIANNIRVTGGLIIDVDKYPDLPLQRLDLSGSLTLNAGASLSKTGRGDVNIGPSQAATISGKLGSLFVDDGTMTLNNVGSPQFGSLTVNQSADHIKSGTLTLASTNIQSDQLSGAGTIRFLNGSNLSTGNASNFNGSIVVNTDANLSTPGAMGSLNVASGVTATVQSSHGATLLGSGSIVSSPPDKTSPLTLNGDHSQFTGAIGVSAGSTLILPTGLANASVLVLNGDGLLRGSTLQFGGSIPKTPIVSGFGVPSSLVFNTQETSKTAVLGSDLSSYKGSLDVQNGQLQIVTTVPNPLNVSIQSGAALSLTNNTGVDSKFKVAAGSGTLVFNSTGTTFSPTLDAGAFQGTLDVQDGILSSQNFTHPITPMTSGSINLGQNGKMSVQGGGTFYQALTGTGLLEVNPNQVASFYNSAAFAGSLNLLPGASVNLIASSPNNATKLITIGDKAILAISPTSSTTANYKADLAGTGLLVVSTSSTFRPVTLQGNLDNFAGSFEIDKGALTLPSGTHSPVFISNNAQLITNGELSGAISGPSGSLLKYNGLTSKTTPLPPNFDSFLGNLNLNVGVFAQNASAIAASSVSFGDNATLLAKAGILGTLTGTGAIKAVGINSFVAGDTSGFTGTLLVDKDTQFSFQQRGGVWNGSKITINSGGTLSLDHDSTTVNSPIVGAGLIRGSNSSALFSGVLTGFTGDVLVNSGTLAFTKGLPKARSVSIPTVAGQVIFGGELGGTITGTGNLSPMGSTATLTGDYSGFTGTLNVGADLFTLNKGISSASLVQIANGAVFATGASVPTAINGFANQLGTLKVTTGKAVTLGSANQKSLNTGLSLDLGSSDATLLSNAPIQASILLAQGGSADLQPGMILNPGQSIVATGSAKLVGGGLINNGTIQGPTGSGPFAKELVIKTLIYTGGGSLVDNVRLAAQSSASGLKASDVTGAIEVRGNLLLAKSNRLLVNIQGLKRGVNYDTFFVDGHVELGGTLAIQTGGDFTPEFNDQFILADPGTISGEFHSYDFSRAPLPKNLQWDTSGISEFGVLGLKASSGELVLNNGTLAAKNAPRTIDVKTKILGNLRVETPFGICFEKNVEFQRGPHTLHLEGEEGLLEFLSGIALKEEDRIHFQTAGNTEDFLVEFEGNKNNNVRGKITVGEGVGLFLDKSNGAVAASGLIEVEAGGKLVASTPGQLGKNASLQVDGIFEFGSQRIFRLSGTGILAGNLINDGVITPGNSTGTLTILGDYRQTSAGKLEIEIASRKKFDRLVVDGSAKLNGGVEVRFLDKFRPKFGDRFDFITADKGVTGELDPIISINGNTPMQVQPTQSGLALVAGHTSLAQAAHTDNQRSLATAIDQYKGAPPKFQEDVSVLSFLPNQSLRSALDALSPVVPASAPQTTLSLVNRQLAQMENRLIVMGSAFSLEAPVSAGSAVVAPTQRTEALWSGFVEGSGIFASLPDVGNSSSFDYTTGAATVGGDYRLNERAAAGFYAGYAGTNADFGGAGEICIDSARFGVYGAWSPVTNLYVYGSVGGASHSYDNQRHIQIPGIDRTARSSTNGLEFNTMAGAGYEMGFGNFSVGPFGSLQYTRLDIDGYSESGAGALDLRYQSQHSDSLQTTLGLKASYEVELPNTLRLVPMVRTAWQHEYLDDSYLLQSQLNTGAGPLFQTTVPGSGRNSMLVTAGVGVQFTETMTGSLYYTGQFDFDETAVNAVQGGLRVEF